MQKTIIYLLVLISQWLALNTHAQQTAIQYLSGTGSDQTVNWQFYCTQGRNSGQWSSIAVPSCWSYRALVSMIRVLPKIVYVVKSKVCTSMFLRCLQHGRTRW